MVENKKFFISLSVLSAAIVGLTLAIRLSLPQFVTPFWWALVLFFMIVNVIVYLLTKKISSKNDLHKFNNFYMLTTIVKLLLYLSVVATYLIVFKENTKAFITTFLIYYLCFTVFETIVLAKKK